jgi:hypothetical protein
MNVSVGDQDVALGNEIIRTTVGSGVHGMAIPGTDDHDEMGVYIELPEQILGLMPTAQHYVARTSLTSPGMSTPTTRIHPSRDVKRRPWGNRTGHT